MEKFKEKTKEIITDKNLYMFTIITIVFFGALCKLQYAPDTYSVFTNDLMHSVKHFLSCGRIVTAVAAYVVMGILKLNNEWTYILSYVFAMVCMITALYRLNKLIQKDIKNYIVSAIIATLMLINPFSLELFLYIEKGVMVLSVLLCVLAVEQMDKFFQGKKKSIIWAGILMIIANCCYQGTVGLFVAISLIYIIKYSKNIKEFIVNNVIVALTYGIPALFNFLLVRFCFTNTRVNGEMIFSESFAKVMDGTRRMLVDSYDLLPKYLFLAIGIILLGIIIYKAIRENISIKEKTLKILGALYLIAGTLFATVAPQMLQDTNSIWFVARSSYPMAAIIGILGLYLFSKFDIKEVVKDIVICILIVFLLVQYVYFMDYTRDNYIGNYLDKQVTIQIYQEILNYEEATGNTVDTIAIYRDKTPQYVYPELRASGDINIKAYSADWCVSRILKFTGRDLKVIEPNEEIKEQFEQKSWDYFSPEQIIFENNVMHLCVF